MKKILFFAAAALSLAACSNEGVITDGVDIPQPSEGTNLSLSLSLPNGEPITYAESHTAEERQIDRIDVYQFDGETDAAKLEEVYREATVGAEQAGKRSVNIYVKSKGKKQFVIVANNINGNPGRVSDIDNPVKGSNGIALSAFKAKVTDVLNNAHMNTKPLLMTGASAVVDVKEGTATATTTVQLTRAMARLDIKNEDNNLLIKRVKLENTSNKAFLFANTHEGTTNAAGVPAGTANANNLPLVTLPTAPTAANAAVGYVKAGNVTTYKHVFYPYPNTSVAAAAQAPTLIIEGELYPGTENAQKVVYRKPLKKATEAQNLGFKRNHVYTFVISKATRDQLEATVKVDKWNTDDVPFPKIEVTAPEVIKISAEGPGVSGVNTNKDARTITVSKNGAVYSNIGSLSFDVKSTTDWEMNIEYQTETGWINGINGPFISAGNTYNALNNRIRFNVQPNTAPSAVVRTAKLIFRSKVDPTKKVEFTLTQQK